MSNRLNDTESNNMTIVEPVSAEKLGAFIFKELAEDETDLGSWSSDQKGLEYVGLDGKYNLINLAEKIIEKLNHH